MEDFFWCSVALAVPVRLCASTASIESWLAVPARLCHRMAAVLKVVMQSCPNSACVYSTSAPKNWFVKYGYFKPKTTNQKTPRYLCKGCKKTFSTHTELPTVNQKKPKINQVLFKLLVSGVSLRRSAEILGVEYNTVVARLSYLAKQAQQEHKKRLLTIKTTFVQVDELETFLHARAKPLSVPMVVRVKTGEILGFGVAKMPSKGLLAQVGLQKYQWSADERSKKFQGMLLDIKHCFAQGVTVKCDGNTSYPKWITNQVPHAQINQIVAQKKPAPGTSGKPFDPLFDINNTFAKMRHDMNRLGRQTWSTTKAIKGLEDHIWLYVAWNNKYTIK